MTNDEVVQYVYAHLGPEDKSKVYSPIILAMIPLACADLAKLVLDTNPELSKKLAVTLANQTWSNSQIAAPEDMFFYKQKDSTRLDFSGILAIQIKDRDKLDLIPSGLANSYYALEGKSFFIKHKDGTVGGSNLNLTYNKLPDVSDIDSEFSSLFLQLLMARLTINSKTLADNNGKQK